MRNYIYNNLFTKDSIDKQLVITTEDGIVIDNTMLCAEEFSIEESLCSENELTYGSCEASCVTFRVANIINPLIGKKLTVSMYLNNDTVNPIQLGVYKVDSDVPTANRNWRDVTCYDSMKAILDADVTNWYATLFPTNETTHTIKEIRNSFFQYLNIQQDSTAKLVNDNIVIKKTINVVSAEGENTLKESITGKDVITRLCEMNGCFGHINYLGQFTYVYLKRNKGSLYPANDLYPSNSLYPKDPSGANISSGYRDLTYEDYYTETVSRIAIKEKESDIGYLLNNNTRNTYTILGNFLLYGKSSSELKTIATNIFNAISFVTYKPMTVKTIGNPCVELGDLVRLHTNRDIFYSYNLSRTISGIQALVDNVEAKGTQYITNKNNSLSSSILQLQGKSNTLERSIEETKSTITDVEQGLETKITQTADAISAEVNRATGAEGTLSSKITQTADAITSEVTRATGAEGSLSSRIQQTARSISLSVGTFDNANKTASISLSVTKEGGGSVSSSGSLNISQITLASDKITFESDSATFVKKSNLTDETTTISGTNITTGIIKSANFSWSSGNYNDSGTWLNLNTGAFYTPKFTIKADGTTYFKGTINGSNITLGGSNNGSGSLTVNGSDSKAKVTLNNKGITAIAGTIGGFTINSDNLTVGDAILTRNRIGCGTAGKGIINIVGNNEGDDSKYGYVQISNSGNSTTCLDGIRIYGNGKVARYDGAGNLQWEGWLSNTQ